MRRQRRSQRILDLILTGIAVCLGTLAIAVLVLAASASGSDQERVVVVNRVQLDAATLQGFESTYRVQVEPGRYWYDRVSGLWGRKGGPTEGQIAPGLALGGRLRADASGGGSAVVVNGRILHPLEIANLIQRFGTVQPGRYWLNAGGIAGFEGGPPQFDLRARSGPGTGPGTPGGGGRRSVLGHDDTGSVLGGGGTVGFIHGGVGVTCGPDGGCIY